MSTSILGIQWWGLLCPMAIGAQTLWGCGKPRAPERFSLGLRTPSLTLEGMRGPSRASGQQERRACVCHAWVPRREPGVESTWF